MPSKPKPSWRRPLAHRPRHLGASREIEMLPRQAQVPLVRWTEQSHRIWSRVPAIIVWLYSEQRDPNMEGCRDFGLLISIDVDLVHTPLKLKRRVDYASSSLRRCWYLHDAITSIDMFSFLYYQLLLLFAYCIMKFDDVVRSMMSGGKRGPLGWGLGCI